VGRTDQLALTPGESAAPRGEQATEPIKSLGLSAGIERILRENEIFLVADLLCFSVLDLLKLKGIGRMSADKVRLALHERGMHLVGDEDWSPPTTKEKPTKIVKRPAWVPMPRIRGSAFNAGMVCPGSVFLAQKASALKVEQENEYTSVGKMGHRYLELRITKSRSAAESYLDNEGAAPDFRIELADLWDWLVGENFLPALSKEEASERGVELLAEHPLSYKAGEVTNTGTLDLVEVIHDAAIVVDWKFYNRPDMLPPIRQDMQMISYGVGAWQRYNVSHVTVHRVLCYHHRKHTLELDSETLKVALEAVTEEAERIWANRYDLRPGAQCRGCFQAFHCPAMAEKFQAVETREIQPYESGDFLTRDDILNFLLAVPVVEARIKEGFAAARRFVQALGEPVKDPTSGMEWGPRSRRQDSIVDAAGCLGELAQITSMEAALTAAKTTKGGIEKVMKGAKLKPAERQEFFEFLRERGLIINAETAPRWEWRKPKRRD